MARFQRKSQRKHVPSTLELSATLEVLKAAEGEEDGLPKFKMLANTGNPMEVDGWYYPVVIDFEGAEFAKERTPALMHHDRRLRLGHTTKQQIKTGRAGNISAEGVVSSTTQAATDYVADSRNGFPFEVSVGARTSEVEFIDAGEKVQVNGRTHKGPLYVARKTLIRELTVDVLGADSKTSAKIAASQQRNHPMTFEQWLEAHELDAESLSETQRTKLEASFQASQDGDPKPKPKRGKKPPKKIVAADPEDSDLDDDDLDDPLAKRRGIEAAESERVDEIRGLFARYSEVDTVDPVGDGKKTIKASTFKANAIRQGMAPAQVENVLLKASMPGGASEGPAIHVKAPFEGPLYSEALSCSIARDVFGMPSSIEARGKKFGYEHQFSQRALEASDDRRLRNPGLHYLMDLVIQAAEGLPFSGNRKSNDFAMAYVEAATKLQGGRRFNHLRASGPFSTLTVNYIFENVANKMLEQRFAMQATTYQDIVRVKNLSDFKPHTLYRLDENMGYKVVGPAGELKSGSLTDSKKTVQADTYGILVALTLHHIRNDDMDAFRQILIGLVEGSSWQIESAVYTLLLANAGNFFHASNGNLTDVPLGIPGVTACETLFSNQVSASGKPIMSQPDRLIVGTNNGVLASDIFGKSNLLASEANGSQVFVENPHKGKYRVIKTPYLNNTAIRTPDGHSIAGQDLLKYFLMGNPEIAAAIILGAVDGRVSPFIESGETSFDTLGMQWRAYHHIGVAQGDPEGAVMSTGDAEESA